jgi:FkbM family methyltransferase
MATNINEHLLNLKNNIKFPKDHVNYLYKLKENGFEPKIIYDIGCCVLHWTTIAQKIWPNAKIIVFDAFTCAEFLYKNHDYFLGVLSREDNKIVRFYQNDTNPGGNSYYKEIGHYSSNELFNESTSSLRYTHKLDTIVNTKNFPLPDLVKIDVQGSEKDVILGGLNTFKNTTHLIVELQHLQYNENAPLASETVPFIESLGFKCVAPLFCNNGPDGDYGFKNSRNIKYL